MKHIKTLLLTLGAMMLPCQTMLAVTDKEMEEARAYTAKSYLRYVNNGSGYLDDVTAKSMAELTAKLKAKEKENLQAFNAVKTPTDYASWDKKRLVEYWSATFFTSAGLDPNGKGARSRVRKYIEEMNISAPTAAAEAAAPEAPKTEAAPAKAPAATSETAAPATAQEAPAAIDPVEQEANILADQQAIEKVAEESREPRAQEENRTWVYVLVLAILIGVVIWLVVYAANLMKRQPESAGESDGEPKTDAELREQTKRAIAAKNQELQTVRAELESARERAAEAERRLEEEKGESRRLRETLERMRQQAAQNAPRQQAAPATPPAAAPAAAAPRAGEQPRAGELKDIYLGRVNKRGIFVRADRKPVAEGTIYKLHSDDGLVGTFHVVDTPEVVDLAMSNPTEWLGFGCTGEDLEDTAGVTRITTLSAGTAIHENGYWKVLRKTRIQYE
ncbi:MAG: hypothetical protein K2N88_02940 [Muribaculaceae bacterium]|nr:hypothetical protein [Muribaculaceae bacterium]